MALSGDTGRANWSDPVLRKTFIDLCLHEANNGGRSGGTLKPASWNRIIVEFKEKIGRSYSQKQLKNGWDYMKKQYMIWTKLTTTSGHGYNASTHTINWPDERWEEYLKTHRDAKQFRYKSLLYVDDLATLFDGVLATGSSNWGPLMDGLPLDVNSPDVQSTQQGLQDHIDMDSQNPSTSTLHTTSVPSLTINLGSDTELQVHEKRRKKCKELDTRSKIEAIVKMFSKEVDDGPTVEECMLSLREMTTLSSTDRLYFVAITAFCDKKEYRQAWMNLEGEETRKAWLAFIAPRLGG